MQFYSEHSFIAWLVIIGAVCLAIAAGALIDRFFINRRSGRLQGYGALVRPIIIKEISSGGAEFKK